MFYTLPRGSLWLSFHSKDAVLVTRISLRRYSEFYCVSTIWFPSMCRYIQPALSRLPGNSCTPVSAAASIACTLSSSNRSRRTCNTGGSRLADEVICRKATAWRALPQQQQLLLMKEACIPRLTSGWTAALNQAVGSISNAIPGGDVTESRRENSVSLRMRK